MTAGETELATLRAEVAQLRRELDQVLTRLDLPNSREPDYAAPDYPNMEFSQVNVRSSRMQIPVVVHSNDEQSGVYLYDAQHRERGRLIIDADGRARLEILNAEGRVAASIGEEDDAGRGEVRVNAADGATRAGLKVNEFGGVVSVVDARGKTLATMLGGADGGQVYVCTPLQKPAVTLKSMPEGGIIIVAEPSGQAMGNFTVTALGAALSVYGEHGAPAVTLSGLGELGGTLVFYTRDGEVKTMLP